MKIVNRLFIATTLVGLSMSLAYADISMAQADCANVNYRDVAKEYENQMKTAMLENNKPLLRQAEQQHQWAMDNAEACDAFAKAHNRSLQTPTQTN